MEAYRASDPGEQARQIRQLLKMDIKCPQCGTVAKWRYYYYETSHAKDSQDRCTAHEIVPTPGPASEPDYEKIGQLY